MVSRVIRIKRLSPSVAPALLSPAACPRRACAPPHQSLAVRHMARVCYQLITPSANMNKETYLHSSSRHDGETAPRERELGEPLVSHATCSPSHFPTRAPRAARLELKRELSRPRTAFPQPWLPARVDSRPHDPNHPARPIRSRAAELSTHHGLQQSRRRQRRQRRQRGR